MATEPGRTTKLDWLWASFLSPEALAVAQLWVATWNEPELVPLVRGLQRMLVDAITSAFVGAFGDRMDDQTTSAALELALVVIAGLLQSIPVSGRRAADARWQRVKPALLASLGPSRPVGA